MSGYLLDDLLIFTSGFYLFLYCFNRLHQL